MCNIDILSLTSRLLFSDSGILGEYIACQMWLTCVFKIFFKSKAQIRIDVTSMRVSILMFMSIRDGRDKRKYKCYSNNIAWPFIAEEIAFGISFSIVDFLRTLLYHGSFDTPIWNSRKRETGPGELELVACTFLSEIARAISFALYVLSQGTQGR